MSNSDWWVVSVRGETQRVLATHDPSNVHTEFYWNDKTGETSWESPEEVRALKITYCRVRAHKHTYREAHTLTHIHTLHFIICFLVFDMTFWIYFACFFRTTVFNCMDQWSCACILHTFLTIQYYKCARVPAIYWGIMNLR